MISKKIGIVGVNGKFGSWFERFFLGNGCKVKGCDFGTEETLASVTKWAEVVIFCVPLNCTVKVIREAIPYSRPNQLWMDVASLKFPIEEEMQDKRIEYVGLHPLFAPTAASCSWAGGTVALCSGKLIQWKDWAETFFIALRANMVKVDAEIHDNYMCGEQNLPHAFALALGLTYEQLRMDPAMLFTLSTKLSRKQLAVIARLLSNGSDLFADIQLMNPNSLMALDLAIRHLSTIRLFVAENDKEELVKKFEKVKKYLGLDFIENGLKEFENS